MKKTVLFFLIVSVFISAQTRTRAGTSGTLITASNKSPTGKIKVYFNLPIDSTIAMTGNAAQGKVKLDTSLLLRINEASYSIDFAVYSFNGYGNITNALINAKNRGVKIRVVCDAQLPQANLQSLITTGVSISRRPSTQSGKMHNSFFLFDARDSYSWNDWVWTGSWNPNSTESLWKNNVIEINDSSLAAAYQTEFEEMWGSNTDTPYPANAKFGSIKTDNTPHNFTIDGHSVELYFGPTDGTNSRINASLTSADSSIHFALSIFTMNDLAQTIKTRYLATTPNTFDLKGIINNVNVSGSQYVFLKGFADILPNVSDSLYDKYCIVDASFPANDPLVITGSRDWTTVADTSYDDNTLIIHDLKIANQYLQDFKKRYNELGGNGGFVIPTYVKDNTVFKKYDVRLYQNYPNPFNPTTTIRFESHTTQQVKIELFNSLGQKIAEPFKQIVKPGMYSIDVNSSLLKLVSGVYYYRLTTPFILESMKMILIK